MNTLAATRKLLCLLVVAGCFAPAKSAEENTGTSGTSAYSYWQQGAKFYDKPDKAIPYYELALKTPFTDTDTRLMNQWCHSHLCVSHPENLDESKARMHDMIINRLSRCYMQTGQAKKAEVLLHKMNSGSPAGVPSPELAKFAGQVQEASGARTIESNILNQQQSRKQDSAYWHSRAMYFQGRNQTAEADKAFEKALVMAPSPEDPNLMPVRLRIYEDYNRYLTATNRPELLAGITRKELTATSANSWYANRMLIRLSSIEQNGSPIVQQNDPAVWGHLSQRKTWGYCEQEMLKVLFEKIDRQTFVAKMDTLTAGADPSRSFRVGLLFNEKSDYAQAIKHLEYVYNRMPPTFDPKHYMVSGDDIDYMSCMRGLARAYEQTGQTSKAAAVRARMQ